MSLAGIGQSAEEAQTVIVFSGFANDNYGNYGDCRFDVYCTLE